MNFSELFSEIVYRYWFTLKFILHKSRFVEPFVSTPYSILNRIGLTWDDKRTLDKIHSTVSFFATCYTLVAGYQWCWPKRYVNGSPFHSVTIIDTKVLHKMRNKHKLRPANVMDGNAHAWNKGMPNKYERWHFNGSKMNF